jgi:competence protein ComEA
MSTRRILLGALAFSVLVVPAFAEDMKPSAGPAPGVSTTRPSTTGASDSAVTSKINLNTASPAELDKLPKLGPTYSKAIVDARAKAKFKDWNDFVARKVVPADTAAAIKGSVTF